MKILKYDVPEINWDKKIAVELSLKEFLMIYDAVGHFVYDEIERDYITSEVPYTYKEHSAFYDGISALVENEIDMSTLQI